GELQTGIVNDHAVRARESRDLGHAFARLQMQRVGGPKASVDDGQPLAGLGDLQPGYARNDGCRRLRQEGALVPAEELPLDVDLAVAVRRAFAAVQAA